MIERIFVRTNSGSTQTPSHHERRRIKKLPVELRRPRKPASAQQSWIRQLQWRFRNDAQLFRSVVQGTFILLCLWIGFEFHLFVTWGIGGGGAASVPRPPGVEGFLPISALISLKYWVETGIINQVHPAGLMILLAIVLIGIGLKKAFCSWLCPIGTLSESLWMLGEKMFGRNLRIPRWLDYPLRSLKYLLLLFFGYAIWNMDVPAMTSFIESPYNKMADVKMYLFFADLSSVVLWTVLILVALSVVVKNLWCRYLCPYGALLGMTSMLSPLKITRQKSSCIDCELCTKACPSAINVHTATRVWSDECTACMKCVDVCPVVDTLDLRSSVSARPVPSWVFGALVVGVFVAVTGLAMLTGHWQNNITPGEYSVRFRQLNSQQYQHPFSGSVYHDQTGSN